MKRILPLLTFFFVFILNVQAQQIYQLYYEDFNFTSGSFGLNTGGIGTNSGPNQWVINDEYTGGGGYPNTPDQTQTVSGTIAGAPYSNYLHIDDANTAATNNANYNPAVSSDRFTAMNFGFCTLGLTDVTLTFFYLAEGNANDYGLLYYSVNGGASWIQTGLGAYNLQPLWKYTIVTNPAFDNQIDVRFGWRWINSTGAAPTSSFSIDDIIVVGTYDNVNNPVTIDITSVSPNPLCMGGILSISFTLSAPLCQGSYLIEMSDVSGNFSNTVGTWSFSLPANFTAGAVSIITPTGIVPGGCYKIRISRVSPPPAITGTGSICFTVQNCPNTITTLQPAVTFGPDTLCVHSVIDVPFYSTGTFNFNNQYIAELSDVTGSFASPQVIGSILDPSAYDPNIPPGLPGTVSGLVPTTPPGCNYYIRVRSTNPNVIPPPQNYFGPFCIRECDVTTNDMEDISVCITDNVGVDTIITIDISTWNTNTTYLPGNEFQVQVIDATYYTIINTGGLGTVLATTSTTMTLSIPGLNQLVTILGPPGVGTYYMRIIATNCVPASQNYGTLIHLTIGSADTIPPLLIPSDTIICTGDLLSIFYFPDNSSIGSQYQWFSPNLNNGQAFFWDYNPITINFAGAGTGTYWFTVREFNYGCWGPWADTVYIDLISVPATTITNPNPVCTGDTIVFQVTYLAGTYYAWTATWGTIVDTSNNQITMVFDSAGVVNLSVFALNMCGSSTGNKTVTIYQDPVVTAPPDTSVCPGSAVILNANSNGTSNNWSVLGGFPFATSNPTTVNPIVTTTYVIQANGQAGCKDFDTTIVTILDPPIAVATATDVLCFGDTNGTATGSSSTGTNPLAFEWNTNPVQSGVTATGLPTGTYDLIVTDADGCMDTTSTTVNEPPDIGVTVSSTSITGYGAADGTATADATGGTPPYTYQWNTIPAQTTQTATGLDVGTYQVIVTDANGCEKYAEITIENATNVIAVPNAFTPNADGFNDVFQVWSLNAEIYSIKIFNRWGQLVFESNDINISWDGRHTGADEETGTYVYYIRVTYLDGTAEEKSGNVALLR